MSTEGRRFYSFSYPQSLVQGIVHDVYSIDIYIFTKRCLPRYLVKGRKKREEKGVRRKEKRKRERGKSGGRGGKKKVDGSKGEGKKVKM